MASSLELNKLLAGVLTAGVIVVGAGVFSGLLYSPRPLEEQAFAVVVDDDDAETAAPDAETTETEEASGIEALLASADPAAGQTITRQCTACHVFDEGGDNRVGPVLWNVVGRDVASVDGFAYSDALQGIDGEWTYEKLDGFLANPREWAPGTSMSYAGVQGAEDRANLIAYLREQSGDPVPLPDGEEVATAEPEAASDEAAEAVAEPAVAAADETAEGSEPAEAAAEATATAEGDEASTEVAEETAEATEEEVATTEDAVEETAEVADSEPAEAETAEADAAEAGTDVAAADPAESAPADGAPTEEVATDEAAADESAETDAGEVEVAEAAPAEATEEAAGDAAETADAESGGEMSGIVALVAAADPATGEQGFRQCAACHTPNEGGGNRVGPNLWGVFGADVASKDGFNYSDALTSIEGVWTVEKLDGYLENPREYASGNRMGFGGLRDEATRAAVIAYLRSLSNDPAPVDIE